MTRVARVLPYLAIACCLSLPVARLGAQEAAPPATAVAAPPATAEVKPPATEDVKPPVAVEVPNDAALTQNVDDFWHYARIGRYDLAVPEGQKVLAYAGEPIDEAKALMVLRTFETVSAQHKDPFEQRLLAWQRVNELKDMSAKLNGVIVAGQKARRNDPKFIIQQIDRLAVNQQAFLLALARLRDSGEIAVPFMVDYLQNPAKKAQHASIEEAIRQMGRLALNPLISALDMKDMNTLPIIVRLIGEIGFTDSVPFLLKLHSSPQTPDAAKAEIEKALAKLNVGDPKNLSAAQLFYDLAEKLYYDSAAIRADQNSPTACVWSWIEGKGLTKKDVPRAIFNEVMAMRACRLAFEVDPTRDPVVSLWLAANFKREAELAAGEVDPTQPANGADAHTWGVRFGARYLGPVLNRALRDSNSAVAYRALRSMGDVVGQANLLKSDAAQAVFAALDFNDRLVRFEAAFVIASCLPQDKLPGSDRIISTITESLAQTGKSGIVVMGAAQFTGPLVDTLNKTGTVVAKAAADPQTAMQTANSMAAVDAVVFSAADAQPADLDRLLVMMGQSPRLARVPRVVIASAASPWTTRAIRDPYLTVTQVVDGAAMAPVFEEARKKAGTLPLDENTAKEYSLRAASLLETLAINKNQVLPAQNAQGALLTALDDARPDIQKAAGAVLARLDAHEVQSGLLVKGGDEKLAAEVRSILLKDLAINGKTFGNRLDGTEVDALRKIAVENQDAKVRSAASEAYGALNLPVEQVKPLILEPK